MKSLDAKLLQRAAIAAGLLLWIGLGYLPIRLAHRLKPVEMPASVNGIALAREMEAHVNGVVAGLLRYLNSRDSDSLQDINWNGQEIHRLLGEYRSQTPPALRGSVDATGADFEKMREATVNILQAENSRQEEEASLQHKQRTLQHYLTDPISAAVRPDQLNAFEKIRAILQGQNAVSALAPDRSTDELNAIDGQFQAAMKTYEDLSQSKRTSAWSAKARDDFSAALASAKQCQALKAAEAERMTAFRQAFTDLEQALDVSARSGAGTLPVGTSLFARRWFAVLWMIFIVLAAGLMIVGALRLMEQRIRQPMRQLIKTSEAAASGDLEARADLWSRDEMGELAQSLNRLIAVLARSENLVYHLAGLVEATGDAVISQNLEGTILSWNKGAQRLYGFSAEEVKGKPITIVAPGEGEKTIHDILDRVGTGQKVQPVEMIHQAKNGRSVRVLVKVAAVFDSTKKVIGASFCAQDLTGADGIAFPAVIQTGDNV